MRNYEDIGTETFVTAIFWEPFSAGNAITALLGIGFADTDIDAIGVLEGQAPDLRGFLASLGLPPADATYYNDCFQDGAVLLVIRAQPPDHQIALEVMRRHGGMAPPSSRIHDCRRQVTAVAKPRTRMSGVQ
jgi:hypothetical protein